MIFVPPRFAADSILEAEDAGIELIICITEGIPAHDELRVYNTLKKNGRARLIGPNCPGILSPGKASVGIIPASFFSAGNVGVVSRSGTLTYQIGNVLAQSGFGNSIDRRDRRRPGAGHRLHRRDRHVPGRPRDRADRHVRRDRRRRRGARGRLHRRPTSPSRSIGYIAGFTAPPGKTMGHAGRDRLRLARAPPPPRPRRWRPRACRSGRTPTQVAETAVALLRQVAPLPGPAPRPAGR